jgi:hypothetical protein
MGIAHACSASKPSVNISFHTYPRFLLRPKILTRT